VLRSSPRKRAPRPARWYDEAVRGKPISQQSRRGPGPLFGAICCSMFVLAGLVMAWFMYVHPAIQGRQTLSSWQRVPCTIVSSKIGVHRGSKGSSYSIDISYRYQFNGGLYTSNRWGFFGGSSSGYREKAAVVARYPRGARATCYVDPANPSQSVLEPHSTAPMIFAFLPIGFIAIGGFVTTAFVIAAVRGQRPPPGERPGAADRPLVLRAGAARATRFIGISLFALVWNGFFAPVAWHVMGSSDRSSPLIALILSPFGLIGIGLLIGSGYFALALLNPRVAITLGRGAIPLGGTVDVQWAFVGRFRSPRHRTGDRSRRTRPENHRIPTAHRPAAASQPRSQRTDRHHPADGGGASIGLPPGAGGRASHRACL